MNSLVLLIICVAILAAGYICYGGWLCKQWGVGESKTETPAHTMEDGVDYVPAKAPVLMGHHFSSIEQGNHCQRESGTYGLAHSGRTH